MQTTTLASIIQYKVGNDNYDRVMSYLYQKMLKQPVYIQISTEPFAVEWDIMDTNEFKQDAQDCMTTKRASKNRAQDVQKTAKKHANLGKILSQKTASLG